MARTVNLATVHWKDPRWIEPQAQALRRHFRRPVRVFANLEGIDGYDGYFFRTNRDGGEHATKLNTLGREMVADSDDDDIIVFLDGDAFPIRPMDEWIDEMLESAPLAAVQRLDNAGDVQPHPCFCVTTAGFWRTIGGDWRRGPMWTNANGVQITDVGAQLMAQLEEREVGWTAIHRSNDIDEHPVMFGIYGKHVYHHGAGFRSPVLRIDGSDLITPYLDFKPRLSWRRLPELRPSDSKDVYRAVRARWRGRRVLRRSHELQAISHQLFDDIARDPLFFSRFETTEASGS